MLSICLLIPVGLAGRYWKINSCEQLSAGPHYQALYKGDTVDFLADDLTLETENKKEAWEGSSTFTTRQGVAADDAAVLQYEDNFSIKHPG